MSQPYKTLLTLDFETRWSSKVCEWSPDEPYTLSKLTTEQYIRDERFKAFGCCIHEFGTDKQTMWYRGDELPRILKTYDWNTTAVLAHNAMFDIGILSMVYGVNPCFIFDSLSMARALRGVEVGNSLAKLADAFGLPPKGNAVHSTDGLEEITPEIERELMTYCQHDVFLCEQIFSKLLVNYDPVRNHIRMPYPTKELRLINMTIKMFTQPQLVLDVPMLEEAVLEDAEKLAAVLENCGVTEEQLASNLVFAALLERMGVEPPTKLSKTTGERTLALAKNDALFQALLNGENEEVALLCEARLKVKSTLERTRAKRFIDIASRGALPVPLNYYGAETGRWAATGSINLQNMKRGSFLRKAIMAPPGYVIMAGDLSQIEPRVLAWLAGYEEMLETFRSGGDPYATFGAQMFSIPGLTKESHPLLRQSAKSALLGAGYYLGWQSFAAQLLVGFLGAPPVRYTKAEAKQLGVHPNHVQAFANNPEYVRKMGEIAHTCSEVELLVHCVAAKAIIDKYRAAAAPVVEFWGLLGHLIQYSLIDGNEYAHKGVLHFRKGEIVLPSGMSLKYPNLRQEKEIDEATQKPTGRMVYVYDSGAKRKFLHSGKVCNNVTQGIARCIMTDGMLRAEKVSSILFTVHDEFGIVTLEAGAEAVKSKMLQAMLTPPKWGLDIPLSCEVGYAKRYGDAKG